MTLGNNAATGTTTGENRWTNQIAYYNPLSAAGQSRKTLTGIQNVRDNAGTTYSAPSGGLITAFDEMWLKCNFIPPSTKSEYFEKAELNRQMILCSRDGLNQYKNALRASNDTLVSYQDAAYSNPMFSGIELMYCANLDTAAIFPNAGTRTTSTGALSASASTTAGVTEAAATDAGARYYWVNGNYLTPIYHSRRYFSKHEVMKHPNQPFTYVQVVDCWWNLFCNSRQRHGIVAPLSYTVA
jgi:hypothetical protein